jgi:hypothetical protein
VKESVSEVSGGIFRHKVWGSAFQFWTKLLAEISAKKFTGIRFTGRLIPPGNMHFLAEFSTL